MDSQLNESSGDNIDRIWWNPYNILSRPDRLYVTRPAIILIGFVFIFTIVSQTKHYQYFFEKIKAKSTDSFHTLPQNLEKKDRTSKQEDAIGEDLKLYNILQYRAKNRSNRYYLHDFEYFRMIRDEFPQTESAAKVGHFTNFVPLSTTLDPKDVLFIVMGSIKYAHKAQVLTETWLQWSQGNFFIFADAANASIPLTTLPQFKNKPSKADAQHRQLLGSQWLINNKSDLIKKVKWFVFVDDDTWINVPALLSYLQYFDYRMLLSVGYIWDDVWMRGWSYFSGGAGIVFSQSAFMLTMPAIYTKECPFNRFNDLTLMYCQKQKGITKIHSDRFASDHVRMMSRFPRLLPIYYVSKISFHYINNATIARRMTCDVAIHWKWLIKGCNGIKRVDMPHLVV